jgi:hypothetical protein
MLDTFQGRRAYIELSEEIFRELGLPPPVMTHDVGLPLITTLEVAGVLFTVVHASDIEPSRLLVECTFGPLPVERRIAVLTTLLRANQTLLQVGAGTFAYDAEARAVLYIFAQPLEEMRAASLLEHMAQVAQYAQQWQITLFLDGASPFDRLHPIEIDAEELTLYRHQLVSLADEVSNQLQVASHTEIEEDQQRLTRRLYWDEATFSLSHVARAAPLLTLSYFGSQVQKDDAEEALCTLLQFNHELAYSGDPVFCLDAASGNVIFACCSPLEGKTTPIIIAKMTDMSEQASRLCHGEEAGNLPVTTPARFQFSPTMFA